MKKAAILQSNYIPWKGYFDMINIVDTFIIFDEMQYTRRDWRNRNQIKTANGLIWLTIPVNVKGKYHQKISETEISEPGWNKSHWSTIKMAYGKAPFFKQYADRFEQLYLEELSKIALLSEVNLTLMKAINDILEIKTEILLDRDLGVIEGKSERLLDLCLKVDAKTYISGPAAKDYLDVEVFNNAGLDVEWMDYSGYKEYPQLHGDFEHAVSVLDLIFNTGSEATSYMKSFK